MKDEHIQSGTSTQAQAQMMDSDSDNSECEVCKFIQNASCVFAENEMLIATLDRNNHEIIILKEHMNLTIETLDAIYEIIKSRFSDATEIEFQKKDQHVFIHIHAY